LLSDKFKSGWVLSVNKGSVASDAFVCVEADSQAAISDVFNDKIGSDFFSCWKDNWYAVEGTFTVTECVGSSDLSNDSVAT
jgi:hypothetical protein